MSDSWLLDLVDDPETDLALSKMTVETAIAELAMSREDAEAAFLPPDLESGPEPEIEIEDLYRMMSDIMSGKPKPHIETKAGWESWRTLEREIAEIKAQGGVVDFPAM